MFDHVAIRASDRARSEAFYRLVLDTLGVGQTHAGSEFSGWGDFSLAAATAARPVTQRLHIGFAAPSRAHVDAFWRAGTEAGHPDDGAPGPRSEYGPDYYGGFLLDPDGNSAEAVHHDGVRRDGVIDHVWIRVADVAAARAFYGVVAPYAGFALRTDLRERAQWAGASGSFSLVAGTPTAHVHLAFPVGDDAVVDAFHRTATAAGHRDDGAPGERPHHHPGYYAALVLDPDGNSVELVNRHR